MADASVAADVDLVFDDVQAGMGGLDVLVNNAGIAGPTGPIEDIDAAGWERTIAVNLNSQYYFARRAVPLLKQSTTNPVLIAMGSVAGRLGYAFRTPYASSKWAIVGLTKSLAIELGPHGIRVNAILPGVVEGERMQGVIAARAASLGISEDAMREQYLQKISLRRMVTRRRRRRHGAVPVLAGRPQRERAGHQRRRKPRVPLKPAPRQRHIFN